MSAKQRRPSKGWIYYIDPGVLSLKCHNGHYSTQNLSIDQARNKHEDLVPACPIPNCKAKLHQTSRIFKDVHYYVVWSVELLKAHKVFLAMPMSSQPQYDGSPFTVYVPPTQVPEFTKDGNILVFQLTCIDERCFKDDWGNWFERVGTLNTKQRADVQETIDYMTDAVTDRHDWFCSNPTEAMLKAFPHLSQQEQESVIEELMERRYAKDKEDENEAT